MSLLSEYMLKWRAVFLSQLSSSGSRSLPCCCLNHLPAAFQIQAAAQNVESENNSANSFQVLTLIYSQF